MRLATFNMESFGADRHDPDALTPRLDALRPKILELEADILCLQEVNAQKRKGVSARQFQALELLLEERRTRNFTWQPANDLPERVRATAIIWWFSLAFR